MSRRSIKLLSLFLSLLILLTMTVSVNAQSSDYSGNWASAQIGKWIEAGVFMGNPDGSFKPANSISRAEFAAVISRLFSYTDTTSTTYSDVEKTAWYHDAVARVTAAGIMQGNNGKFMPKDSISRQEAMVVFYRAFDLKVKNVNAISKFVDAGQIAPWSKDAFNAAVENSYISGQPGNKAAPKANITRAECAKLIDNIAGVLKNKAGTYTGVIPKNLVVNTKDVILKDMVINGDLFLAQGIGDGTVTLDNVVVKGRTVVRGGGENSIILKNTSLEGTLIIIKKDGKIRIVAQGSTVVTDVELNSGAKLEEEGTTGEGFGNVEIIKIEEGQTITLDGDFAEVSVETPGADINVTSGTIGNFVIADTAADSTVQIAAGATVTALTADAVVEVKGTGTITTANINVAGVKIEQTPANINVGEGIEANVGGETVTGEETSGGGGGGGGDGNDGDTTSVTITNAYVAATGGDVNGTVSGDTAAVNLSGKSIDTEVTSVNFTTNATTSSLLITTIDSSEMGEFTINKTFTFSSGIISIDANDLLAGIGSSSVSVGTLRALFGDSVTVNATLTGTGNFVSYTPATFAVTLTLQSGGDSAFDAADYFSGISRDGSIITATIIGNQTGTLVSSITGGVRALFAIAAGAVPSVVKCDDDITWYDVSDEEFVDDFKAVLVEKTHKAWGSITLEDLKAYSFYFKMSSDDITEYTVNFQ